MNYTAMFRSVADFSSAIRESDKLSRSWATARKEGQQVGETGQQLGDRSEKGSAKAAAAAKKAGTAMTVGITLPLAAAATAAVHTYAEFETAIVSAGSKSNATATQLEAMKDAALDVGNTTKFSAREAASGLDILAAAGFNAEQAVTALPAVTMAAQAANEDLGLTAGVVAKSLNAFNLQAGDAAHVADVLAQASNTTALDMLGLQDALGQAGEVGARYGQSLEDVVAVTGRLVDMGVPAASAGTAVRQALTSLAAPTVKANNLLTGLGIATRDAAGEMLPIPDLVRNVSEGLAEGSPALQKYSALVGLNEDELKQWAKENRVSAVQAKELQAAVSKGGAAFADYATKTLFGVEGAKAFSLAMSDGKPVLIDINDETDKMTRLTDGLAKKMGTDAAQAFIKAHTSGGQFVATGADAVEVISALGVASDGTAEAIGEAFQLTTAQKIDNLKGSVETLAIVVVDKLAPGLNDIVDKTTAWVTSLSDFAEAHPTVTKTGLAFLALTAAAGPALLISGQLISSARMFKPVFSVAGAAVAGLATRVDNYALSAQMAGRTTQAGLLTGVGKVASFLGGPWGIAIGLGVTAIIGFATAQKQAREETKAFTDSLTWQNGALDDNSRRQVANQLAKEGTLEAALKAGISEKDYTDALIEGGPVRDEMIRKLGEIAEKHTSMSTTMTGSIVVQDEVGKAAQRAASELTKMGGSLDRSKTASDQAKNALSGQKTTQSELAVSSQDLEQAQKGLADAQTRVKQETDKVIDAFTVLKGGSISAERAAIRYEEALDGLTVSAKENGTSLSRQTAAGRANRSAFLGAVEAVNEKISADFKAKAGTDGLVKATKSASGALGKAEKDLRAQAKAAGFSKTETDKMIRTYLKTPKQLKTDVKTPGLKEAQRDVNKYGSTIKGLKNKKNSISTSLGFTAGKNFNRVVNGKYVNMGEFGGGGYTGRGRADEPAGIVHRDEEVIKSPSRKKFERKFPGVLGFINRTGDLPPGHQTGGTVGRSITTTASVRGRDRWKDLPRVQRAAAEYNASIAKRLGRGMGMDYLKEVAERARAAAARVAAEQGGGNGGYKGPVGRGAAGIKKIARSYHPSYIAAHRDPQGGPAFDIGSSGKKNTNIGNALRANHGKLGLRYVIRQMKIASAKSGWGWRGYNPITNKGDWRHVAHVHVSYAAGTRNARRGLALVGEEGPEIVQFGGGEQVTPAKESLRFLSALEGLEGRGPVLTDTPAMAVSRTPTQVVEHGGDTINVPIYYARDDEITTAAAQRRILTAVKDRRRTGDG